MPGAFHLTTRLELFFALEFPHPSWFTGDTQIDNTNFTRGVALTRDANLDTH